MPNCCAGAECKLPYLDLGETVQRCPDCNGKLHDICGVLDEKAVAAKMSVCPTCFGARKPPAISIGLERRGSMSTMDSASVVGAVLGDNGNRPQQQKATDKNNSDEVVAVAPTPRKKTNRIVRDQYNILTGSFSSGGDFQCKHCTNKTFSWKIWNASKARAHLETCSCVPADTRKEISRSSQHAKKKRKISEIQLVAASEKNNTGGGSVDSLESTPLRMIGTTPNSSKPITSFFARKEPKSAPTYAQPANTSSPSQETTTITQEVADRIIKLHVKASLGRFEVPSRICYPSVQNYLAEAAGKDILNYIPTAQSIFGRYVVPIDREVEQEIVSAMQKVPGNLTLAFNEVTALGCAHILSTVSKGSATMFVTMTKVQADANAATTTADVDNTVQQLKRVRQMVGASIGSAAVDDSVADIAKLVIEQYGQECPMEPTMLHIRDPCHSIDLFAKDSAKVECFAKLLFETKSIIRFLSSRRIAGIIDSAVEKGICPKVPKVTLISDNNCHGAADMMEGVLGNMPILNIIETLDSFKEYYASRDSKKSIDDVLTLFGPQLWRRLEIGFKWFSVLKAASKLASSQSFPMSAYLPTVQAMKNGLDAVLSNDGGLSFQNVFDEGARSAITNFVRARFNMDGLDHQGLRCGLLEEYQIWCFVADPYSRFLKPALAIQGGPRNGMGSFSFHARQMLKFFLPISEQDPDGTLERQRVCHQEFMKIRNLEYPYDHKFFGPAPPSLPYAEAQTAEKSLTFQHVEEWVEQWGRHNGRLRFYVDTHQSEYYEKVAKPLLSLKSAGSVSIEQIAKPLENKVATQTKNRSDQNKRAVILRAGLNLRLQEAVESSKSSMGKASDFDGAVEEEELY